MAKVELAGMPKASEDRRIFGIEQLEVALQRAIVDRMKYSFHYDELTRETGVGGDYHPRVRAVRNDMGKIDVFATFMKVRNTRKQSGGGF